MTIIETEHQDILFKASNYIFKDAPTNTAIVCKRFFEHEKKR